jgi:FkbM family methyltransferase
VLFDIGANVGTFALIAARHCRAHVVAFEPGYANFARLCDNIQLNGCHFSIVPVPLPVAEQAGVVGFKYRSVEPGQSRHKLKADGWRFRDPATVSRYEQPVLAMTLDGMISTFRLPHPHHVKIDVDGAEARVLAGARETLRSDTLHSVLIEVDDAQWPEVSRVLEDAGLALEKRIERDKPGAPAYGLFVRRTRASRQSRSAWWKFR